MPAVHGRRKDTLPAQGGANARGPWIETITWKPRAFIYHQFLSGEASQRILLWVDLCTTFLSWARLHYNCKSPSWANAMCK